ncbi:MAG: ATP-binding protein [Novosphingobium sp.]|nr:ATP-binding protein [Novosphingobium sp.]
MIRVCFHGAESTGKSVLARTLSEELGVPWVREYGREYCEAHGIDLTMADLLAIAAGQEAAMRAACAQRPPLVLLDTDPLMTAAWAEMLFGEVPEALLGYPKAERYLLFAPDVPWRADGTRFFGAAETRARFAEIAEAMLVRAGVPYARVAGGWLEREAAVRAELARL